MFGCLSASHSASLLACRPGSQPATRRHDDDEAFALAAIQPFQLGCRGTASVKVAVLVMKEALPRSWCRRGGFISNLLTRQIMKRNGDLAKHEGLCAAHHKALNIDKTVSELPMQNGGVRKPSLPKRASRVNQVESIAPDSIQKLIKSS